MTLTVASWTLWAICLGCGLQSVVAIDELPRLTLCKPSQSRIHFGDVELQTVPVFKHKNESLLGNLFEFQERNVTSGCYEDEPENLSKIQFTSQGYLSIEKEKQIGNEASKEFVWYAPEEFCVQVSSEKRLQAVRLLKCKKDDETAAHPEEPLMVRKCCPPGYAVDFEMWDSHDLHNQCVLSSSSWTPKFYDQESFGGNLCVRPTSKAASPKNRVYTKALETDKIYILGPKQPLMDNKGILEQYRVKWRLLNNGSFAQLFPTQNKWHPYGHWRVFAVECADILVNIGGIGNPESVEILVTEWKTEMEPNSMGQDGTLVLETTMTPETIEEMTMTTEVFVDLSSSTDVGSEASEQRTEDFQCNWNNTTIAYLVCFFLSAPFLLLTIAAFLLTHKSQKVYGWTMLSHLVTFLLMNIAFGVSLWTSACIQASQVTTSCTVVGMVVTFSFLSVYVWLSCVNFELWWTFRQMRSVSAEKSLMRYYIYTAVSIGVPLIFTLTGYILDVTYGEHGYDSDCDIILPEFGLTKCFLAPQSEGVYLYYPLLVLLFFNIVFFLLTASQIYGVRASTKLVRRPTEGIDKDAILLFGKLFVVMGTSCIFEFIAWFAQPELGGQNQEQNLVFVAIDFITYIGRSIAIFLIFACSAQVRVQGRRILNQWGVTQSSPTTSGGTQSSTASGSASSHVSGVEAPPSGGAMKMKALGTKDK